MTGTLFSKGTIQLIVIIAFFISSSILFTQSAKIAYIDSEMIMQNYEKAASTRKQLEDDYKSWEGELKEMENEIMEMENRYENQKETMLQSARQELEEKIMRKYEQRQIMYNEIMGENGKLAKKQAELLQPILDKIQKIIKEIRQEQEISIVFDVVTSGIIDADSDLDISQKVIDKLNALDKEE